MTVHDSRRASAKPSRDSRTPGGRDGREAAHTTEGASAEKGTGSADGRGDHAKNGLSRWVDAAPDDASDQEIVSAYLDPDYGAPAERWPGEADADG